MQSDLALLTVPEDAFWGDDLRPLVFLKEVPELQVRSCLDYALFVPAYITKVDDKSWLKGVFQQIYVWKYGECVVCQLLCNCSPSVTTYDRWSSSRRCRCGLFLDNKD
jgi:hypothetical protein